MSEKWEDMKDAAIDAISKTLENSFDVVKTAQELNEKYSNDNKTGDK
ncbi:hypothetical protein [Paenibacillus sp. HB172176]|nr:hypothetical protein [Paenibacillus sp. HB172176]